MAASGEAAIRNTKENVIVSEISLMERITESPYVTIHATTTPPLGGGIVPTILV